MSTKRHTLASMLLVTGLHIGTTSSSVLCVRSVFPCSTAERETRTLRNKPSLPVLARGPHLALKYQLILIQGLLLFAKEQISRSGPSLWRKSAGLLRTHSLLFPVEIKSQSSIPVMKSLFHRFLERPYCFRGSRWSKPGQ